MRLKYIMLKFGRLIGVLIAITFTCLQYSCKGPSHADSQKSGQKEISEKISAVTDEQSVDIDLNSIRERTIRLIKLSTDYDSISSRRALHTFFDEIKSDSAAVAVADSIIYLYLADPNSPFRNENQLISFLEGMLSVGSLPEAISLRAEENLRIASLNRPGSVANDFEYITRNGKKLTLHQSATDKLLLVFYDPECSHCSDILRMLMENEQLNEAVEAGKVKILAIYAEGKRDVWEKTKRELPSNWSVGYDLTGILDKELYDLPAMPTIYLLDSDSRVILKDPQLY